MARLYQLIGSRILQDSKIRFRLQVESYISDWLFSKSRLLASYVSRHKAMAYDSQRVSIEGQILSGGTYSSLRLGGLVIGHGLMAGNIAC